MPLLTPAQAYKLIDKLAAAYSLCKGVDSSPDQGLGDGTFGASLLGVSIRQLIEGSADSTFADADLQSKLVNSALGLKDSLKAMGIFGSAWGNFVQQLSTTAALARTVDPSITNLDSFLLWYNFSNANTYWQCLTPPEWREAYAACNGGSLFPSPKNVYFPVVQGATVFGETFTNALYELVRTAGSDVTTAGKIIDPTKYAGGFPFLVWTGGAGTGAYTITVAGLDQDGAAETWHLTGTGIASSNAGAALTPVSRAYSLITKVTSVTFNSTSAVSDGTFYVESHQPSGRSYPLL